MLLDREVGEDLPAFGNETHTAPREPVRRPGFDPLAAEHDLAASGRMQAADRAHQRRLAHAVAAEERDDLARAHLEVDAVQHLAAAVAGMQAAHREQGLGGGRCSGVGQAHSSPR